MPGSVDHAVRARRIRVARRPAPSGPIFGPPGYEINLLYIASLIALALFGPGALSAGRWFTRRTT